MKYTSKSTKQKSVADKLKEIGMTVDEVKEWLNEEQKAQGKQMCFDFLNKMDEELEDSFDSVEPSISNVVFVPGNRTEETRVYVYDERVEGLIRAHLEYDSELNFPILKLEILNPHIGMPNYGSDRLD